jgi:hypothetical protein
MRPECAVRGAGQVEQVCALGVVEAQRVEHALGYSVEVGPFEAGVVVDADPGEHRDFLLAQTGDASVAAVGGQTGLLRRDPSPPGGRELTDFVSVVRVDQVTTAQTLVGGSAITWNNGTSHAHVDRCFIGSAHVWERPPTSSGRFPCGPFFGGNGIGHECRSRIPASLGISNDSTMEGSSCGRP